MDSGGGQSALAGLSDLFEMREGAKSLEIRISNSNAVKGYQIMSGRGWSGLRSNGVTKK